MQLNPEQSAALDILKAPQNVFLTGVAGSGKTFLLQRFLSEKSSKKNPMLASTGAAAILLGGRTFHSFFGLGIMEGGVEATVERALKRSVIVKRLQKAESIAIDEVSMIAGPAFRAAEMIASQARESSFPWGGLKVIACGDFAQLPPVSPYNQNREWAFLDPAWERSGFRSVVLKTVVRTQEKDFLRVLNLIRTGQVNDEVMEFLDSKVKVVSADFPATRLYPRREMTENYNLKRLAELPGKLWSFPSSYTGREREVESLRKVAPIPEVLQLKEGALVMLRQNDPQGRWANGSLGQITRIRDLELRIALLEGLEVDIEKASFDLLDAEGKKIASVENFPVNLAYASTIHKAQGATLDQVVVNIRALWEPGHAYVALSRVKSSTGLFIEAWDRNSIKVDPAVARFHQSIFD